MARKGENIYKRRDGRWEGRYILGKRPNGSTRYGSIYGKSYTEVRERLRKKKAEAAPIKARCPLTIKELMAQWLEAKRFDVKQSSFLRYEALIERHILPEYGEMRLSRLTAQMLNEFIDSKLQRGRLDGRGGLAPKTVSDIVIVLRSALRMAKNDYCIPESLFSDVMLPAAHPRRVNVMCEQETARFTEAALKARDPTAFACLLSLNTGLRLGELCALKWSDFDLTEGTVHVARTAQRNRDGLTLQTPKSASSDRLIPLTEQMLPLLGWLREETPDGAFVLTGKLQRPMEPRTLQYRFHRFLEKNSFRDRNFHSLRHSFATRCIANGMDAKTLSEILGHADVKTTLQLYVHPSMEQKRAGIRAACTIGSLIA